MTLKKEPKDDVSVEENEMSEDEGQDSGDEEERTETETPKWTFEAFLEHRANPTRLKHLVVLVRWSNGEETWEPLENLKEDDPVTLAMYAQEQGLLDQAPWKWARRHLGRQLSKPTRQKKQSPTVDSKRSSSRPNTATLRSSRAHAAARSCNRKASRKSQPIKITYNFGRKKTEELTDKDVLFEASPIQNQQHPGTRTFREELQRQLELQKDDWTNLTRNDLKPFLRNIANQLVLSFYQEKGARFFKHNRFRRWTLLTPAEAAERAFNIVKFRAIRKRSSINATKQIKKEKDTDRHVARAPSDLWRKKDCASPPRADKVVSESCARAPDLPFDDEEEMDEDLDGARTKLNTMENTIQNQDARIKRLASEISRLQEELADTHKKLGQAKSEVNTLRRAWLTTAN